jgi:hypothetical protein
MVGLALRWNAAQLMAVYPLYVAATPYNASELRDIDYAQSFDTIYLANIVYPVGKMVRTDHADWLYSDVEFEPEIAAPANVAAVATVANTDAANSGNSYFPQDYSYCVSAVNADGQESRGSTVDTAANDTELPRNYTTITWDAVAETVYYRVYKAHESGSLGFIGESETTSFVDDGFQPEYSDAPIEAYNPFAGAGNYPARVGFWEQRLWLGRTATVPHGIWGSRSADFENMDFARPQRENDSIAMAITTGQTNAIEFFLPMERLRVGTSDNVFALRGPNDDVLVPNPPPGAKREPGPRGVSSVKPIAVGEVAFYQPRVETGVRALGFAFEVEGAKSSDVSIFAPHLFEHYRIKRWAFQEEPYSILWVARDDGALLAFTWEAEQEVWGWTEIDVGGLVLDVVCIPEGPESRVYLTVEREIDGETVRYVEQLDRAKWTDYRSAAFVDSARLYEFDEPTTEITGLQHLEGEEVTVLMDGYATTATVADGEIELPEPASTVIVGLGYEALIETLPLPDEPKKKITGEIFLEMVDSFDVKAGRREDELLLARTRLSGEIGPPILFTGLAEPVRPTQVVDRQATIIVKQSSPYPMTITGLYYGVEAK